MVKRYVIELTSDERIELEQMVRRGKSSARQLTRARVLLLSDQGEGGPGWTDAAIAEGLGMTTRGIEMLRKRAVEEGPMNVLADKRRDPATFHRKFDGRSEAQLTALACSEPPTGRKRWTLRLLAEKLVELKVFETISYETVRQVMEKKSDQAVA